MPRFNVTFLTLGVASDQIATRRCVLALPPASKPNPSRLSGKRSTVYRPFTFGAENGIASVDRFANQTVGAGMENFHGWIGAVRECLDAAALPRNTDKVALAMYVLAVMEGGVMLSRSYDSV
jgi:hypothetical protein